MKGMLVTWMLIVCSIGGGSSLYAQPQEPGDDLARLADHVFFLSEVMVHDVATPPAASRIYAYSLFGAYQAATAHEQIPRLNSSLRNNPAIKITFVPKKVHRSFCSNYAMLEVGKRLMPSGVMLDKKQEALVDEYKKKGLSDKEIAHQVRYSIDIANQVVSYARADGYGKLSTYARYTPKKGEGFWYPTPPAYMAAVDPQWETIRPFFLDSAGQFAPPKPAVFSTDSATSFFKQMKEVYDVSRTLTHEQRNIANFWDCNPFAVSFSGHMAIGLKKISPGGHWMGITGIACKKAKVSLDSALLIHAVVATTLHDAFISCWKEKYTSHRIRPETAINKYLDPEWRPILQTPPFPEYSSGHSVASAAASVILTHFLGDDFSFTDTSEVYFGLPERDFDSFYQAANEAAISRLYGGIHFRDACENGVAQGRQIAQYILNALSDNQP